MYPLNYHSTNESSPTYYPSFHLKYARSLSSNRNQQAQRHSSISDYAKTTGDMLVRSNKSIGLSFTKMNKSKRSTRMKEAKENKKSSKEIESEQKIKFKGIPPKRKRNPSKFYEDQHGIAFNQRENQNSRALVLNGYLKEPTPMAIDNFVIVKKLGEGSFSQVYQVIQKSSRSLYALKVMDKEGLRELQVVDRLASELKIQHFCNHVNIVKLYGVFHDQSRMYLIQEYSGSKTLYSFMQEKRETMTLKDIQAIVRQICIAVKYLHANCIIHRDIKPENILVAPGGVVKLTDFGWSIHNPDKTLRQTICGTPLYLSPQILTAEKYDQSVDLWAIGVLTYELFTGEMPFGIKKLQDLRNIVTEDIDLSAIYDSAARSFIGNLLTKDISQRKDINFICDHEFLRIPQGSRCE